MDWIITIYFLLGIFQIIVWVAQSMDVQWSPGPDHPNQDPIRVTSVPKSFSKVIFVILALLGLGSLLPLSENIFSQRYQNLTSGQVLAENEGLLKTAGLDIPVIESFLQNDGAEILIGRALYPRYFRKDQQEEDQ